tara:strand:+ start:5952 stop:6686 length:735 start_codon:yes stop_codon:yes gene_type:complete
MEKKLYYTLITTLLLCIAILVVIAAPDNGHDVSELTLDPIFISDGKVGIGTSDPSMGDSVGSIFTVKTPSVAEHTAIAAYNGDIKGFAVNVLNDGSFRIYDGAAGTWKHGLTQKSGQVEIAGNIKVNGNIIGSQGWTDLPLIIPYVHYTDIHGTFERAQYRKIGDIVYLRGLSLYRPGGVNTAPIEETQLGQLPLGFRPPKRLIFSANSWTDDARIDIHADGKITVLQADISWVPLDGIFFSTT